MKIIYSRYKLHLLLNQLTHWRDLSWSSTCSHIIHIPVTSLIPVWIILWCLHGTQVTWISCMMLTQWREQPHDCAISCVQQVSDMIFSDEWAVGFFCSSIKCTVDWVYENKLQKDFFLVLGSPPSGGMVANRLAHLCLKTALWLGRWCCCQHDLIGWHVCESHVGSGTHL